MIHNYNEITKNVLPKFQEVIDLQRDMMVVDPDGYASYNLGVAKRYSINPGQCEHIFFSSNTAKELYRKHLEQLRDELRDELVRLTNKIGEETL